MYRRTRVPFLRFEPRDEMERHVDARGHARRRDDVAVVDKARVRVDVMPSSAGGRARPSGRRRTAVEQPCLPVDERAGADARHQCRRSPASSRRRCRQLSSACSGRCRRPGARRGRRDRARPAGVGDDAQAVRARDRLGRLGDGAHGDRLVRSTRAHAVSTSYGPAKSSSSTPFQSQIPIAKSPLPAVCRTRRWL